MKKLALRRSQLAEMMTRPNSYVASNPAISFWLQSARLVAAVDEVTALGRLNHDVT
jgi:hypothetical protein